MKKAPHENSFSVGAFFICMSELPVAGLGKTKSIPTGFQIDEVNPNGIKHLVFASLCESSVAQSRPPRH